MREQRGSKLSHFPDERTTNQRKEGGGEEGRGSGGGGRNLGLKRSVTLAPSRPNRSPPFSHWRHSLICPRGSSEEWPGRTRARSLSHPLLCGFADSVVSVRPIGPAGFRVLSCIFARRQVHAASLPLLQCANFAVCERRRDGPGLIALPLHLIYC